MAMSDLTQDLVEEVILRVPLTSHKAVRSTCKNWNTLSKNLMSLKGINLAKARAATKQEFLAIVIMDFKVYLMSFDLRGLHNDNDVELSIKREGKLISLNDTEGVRVSRVLHCSGLLLCITKEYNPRLVVWNPCSGQTRWIEPRGSYHKKNNYALGYEMKNKSCRSYKILRYLDAYDISVRILYCEFQIYNFDSNSWKAVQATPRWNIHYYQRGVSLKGNTYWFAQSTNLGGYSFLLCFDFTAERFGPPLPMPIFHVVEDTVTLSSVRDEQLAVLFKRRGALHMEIWITYEIGPREVSWRSKLFLAVNIKPFTYRYPREHGSFFVDEEKKVAVVFGRDLDEPDHIRDAAYITGKDGYLKKVDLGESTFKLDSPYVPSLV
ncbi:unnamed protein product [Arabidopsis lyrata]|nr:unnamed protein product [Arabidopsis lyrata]